MEPDLKYQCPLPKCGNELYVEWKHNIPLEAVDNELTAKDSVNDVWELVCTEGHVLDSGGEETDGRPFNLAEALTRLSAIRNPGRADVAAALERGWDSCPECGQYGPTDMHKDPLMDVYRCPKGEPENEPELVPVAHEPQGHGSVEVRWVDLICENQGCRWRGSIRRVKEYEVIPGSGVFLTGPYVCSCQPMGSWAEMRRVTRDKLEVRS